MDIKNWSNESVLDQSELKLDSDSTKPKIGFVGGCLMALGGFVFLILSICGGASLVSMFSSGDSSSYLVIDNNPRTLDIGKTVRLKVTFNNASASKLTWKSSEPEIISVNDKGEIKALRPGKSIITANIPKVQSAEAEVIALREATKVVLLKSEINIKLGEFVDPAIQIVPANASVYLYSESPTIVGISENKIIGLAPGNTVIYVVKGLDMQNFYPDLQYGSIKVTVQK